MSDFEPSPRSSKRRKITTYGSTRSTAKSPSSTSSSVLRSLSNAASGISRRLFEPKSPQNATTLPNIDSAYGSKQDSLDEEASSSDGVAYEQADQGTTKDGHELSDMQGEQTVTPLRKPERVASRNTRSTGLEESSPVLDSASTSRTQTGGRTGTAAHVEAPAKTTGASYREKANGRSTRSHTGVTAMEAATAVTVEEDADSQNFTDQQDDTIIINQRSSGRERKKPRRYSNDLEDMAEQQRKQPVGILTPSKSDKKRTRKSIAFDGEDKHVEEHLSFKDIQEPTETTNITQSKNKTKTSTSDAKAVQRLAISIANTDAVLDGEVREEHEPLMEEDPAPEVADVLELLSNTTPALEASSEVEEDPHLTSIKANIISRMTGSSLVPLTNLATEYGKIHSLLKATIMAGEGNSILVLGARGSGKTNLIETALTDVSSQHANDFHIVRLNGFQQIDDKIALREIWRQLGREMQVEEDETNQVSSYADTMASLLHLLSHPEELAEVLDPEAPSITTKSVIFVLDEFDLFATHPRQTLLYNLFDIAQAKKAPIAVIGCSTRVDVAESLEKRVKSRFSHRWIHLAQPKSFTAFEEVILAALSLSVNEDQMLDTTESDWKLSWNKYIKVYIATPSSFSA